MATKPAANRCEFAALYSIDALAAEIVNLSALFLAMALLYGLFWMISAVLDPADTRVNVPILRFIMLPVQMVLMIASTEIPEWHAAACNVTSSVLRACIRNIYKF